MSSSSSKIEKNGSENDRVVSDFSKAKSKEGSKSRFVNIATPRVIETSNPRYLVPSNSDMANIKKPKNKTIDVYIMLTPVSFRASITESLMFQPLKFNSCLYLAKK